MLAGARDGISIAAAVPLLVLLPVVFVVFSLRDVACRADGIVASRSPDGDERRSPACGVAVHLPPEPRDSRRALYSGLDRVIAAFDAPDPPLRSGHKPIGIFLRDSGNARHR